MGVSVQRFRTAAAGAFMLFGPVEIGVDGRVLAPDEAAPLRSLVSEGIKLHPSDVPWGSWLGQ